MQQGTIPLNHPIKQSILWKQLCGITCLYVTVASQTTVKATITVKNKTVQLDITVFQDQICCLHQCCTGRIEQLYARSWAADLDHYSPVAKHAPHIAHKQTNSKSVTARTARARCSPSSLHNHRNEAQLTSVRADSSVRRLVAQDGNRESGRFTAARRSTLKRSVCAEPGGRQTAL